MGHAHGTGLEPAMRCQATLEPRNLARLNLTIKRVYLLQQSEQHKTTFCSILIVYNLINHLIKWTIARGLLDSLGQHLTIRQTLR